ncbi:DUF397 domain-containing protein [Streptomyces sp. A1499]|uniref:DUF397 domain-containing protein n=1 Tax=Streptomyces sp. A1499 TaxID=2563104 RepID=UPI00109EDFF7|nr:DUF397 domain-containing protein [Streptomyces sp. A1499]THC54044.1 DUF397 domain-containing protein [Streptomyces sp. A1499]
MSAEEVGPGLDALAWLKSSHSAGDGGECVEVAARPGRVHVRDSKDVSRAALTVGATAWAAFIGFAAL